MNKTFTFAGVYLLLQVVFPVSFIFIVITLLGCLHNNHYLSWNCFTSQHDNSQQSQLFKDISQQFTEMWIVAR